MYFQKNPTLFLVACVCRLLRRRGSASWFTVPMVGIGPRRFAPWPACCWIRTTGRSEDLWYLLHSAVQNSTRCNVLLTHRSALRCTVMLNVRLSLLHFEVMLYCYLCNTVFKHYPVWAMSLDAVL